MEQILSGGDKKETRINNIVTALPLWVTRVIGLIIYQNLILVVGELICFGFLRILSRDGFSFSLQTAPKPEVSHIKYIYYKSKYNAYDSYVKYENLNFLLPRA